MYGKTMMGVFASLTVLVALAAPAQAAVGGAYVVPPGMTLDFVVPGDFDDIDPTVGRATATAEPFLPGTSIVHVKCNEEIITCVGTILVN